MAHEDPNDQAPDAHKTGNGESADKSFFSVLRNQNGKRIVTALSSNSSIWIHDSQFPLVNPKSLKYHFSGVTALVLRPKSTNLASGSMDHSVKLYKFPEETAPTALLALDREMRIENRRNDIRRWNRRLFRNPPVVTSAIVASPLSGDRG